MADPIYDAEEKPASLEPEDLKQQEQTADDPYRQVQDAWGEAKAGDEAAGRSFYKQAPGEPRRTAKGLLKQKKTWLIAAGSISIIGLLLGAVLGFLNVFKLDHIMSNIDQRAFVRWNAAADRRSDTWIREYIKVRLTMLSDPDGNFDIEKSYYFKAKLDTDHPATDWLKRMFVSNFEEDLAKNHGVAFVNEARGKGIYFTVLKINGEQVLGLDKNQSFDDALLKALRDGDPNIEKKINIDLTKPGASKAARQAIKQETQHINILKRRFVRKAIKNETGVKNWRFFEKTRDRYDAKKAEIRNKIIVAMTPDDTKAGKLIRCVFGIELCRGSTDPKDPNRKAGGTVATRDNPDTDKSIDTDHVDLCPGAITQKDGVVICPRGKPDPNGDPNSWEHEKINKPEDIKITETADSIKRVIGGTAKVGNIIGWIGIIDMLSKFNSNLKNHSLSKLAAAAKAAQAMALYQVFMTSRDQIRSGEVNAQQVNHFMQAIGKGANSEGWLEVVGGKGDPSKLTAEQDRVVDNPKGGEIDYCNDDYQDQMLADENLSSKEHAFLCPSKQVGGTKNNAQIFEDTYNKTLGPVVSPIGDMYLQMKKNSGIVGKIIFGAINVISKIFSEVTTGVMKALGVADDFEAAMTKLMTRLGNFLGAGPILREGFVPPGETTNWLVQGGAVAAEATLRENGGNLTDDNNRKEAQETTTVYENSQKEQLSFFQRYLSLSNPESPTAGGLFALSQLDSAAPGRVLANLGSSFKSVASAITAPFTSRVLAEAKPNIYASSQFANILTFDIPKQCYDLPPFTKDKLAGTNALDVFKNFHDSSKYKTSDGDAIDPKNKIAAFSPSAENLAKLNSWDTQTDSDVFWQLIYDIIVNDGKIDATENAVNDIAMNIYNCNLFDNSVRGGLGALHGFTNDHGLEDEGSDGEFAPGDSPSQIPSELWEIFTMAAAKYNISPYALAAIYGFGEHCTNSGACPVSQVRWPTDLIQTAKSGAGAQGPFQFMPKTWDNGRGGGYKEDCDGDGQTDITNLKDSACAAAHYLAVNGAEGIFDAEPGSHETLLKKAFFAYNHANWYANRVYEGYKKLLASSLIVGGRPTSTAGPAIDFAHLFEDSTSVGCDPRTRDIGIHDGYRNENVVKIRLCALPNLKSNSDASTPSNEFYVNSANGQAIVNARVSGAVFELAEAAKTDGRLLNGAGSAFRTMAHQQYLCSQNEGCRTGQSYALVAKPGTSNHQMGLAMDFYINNLRINNDQCQYVNGRCTAKDYSDWQWLEANAARFGYKQYINEFWHWSPDGG